MIYIYIRMSHRSSSVSGISEAHQLFSCKKYANSLRINPTYGNTRFPDDMPAGVYCDRARSAWRNRLADRPAGAALLSVLKPGDDVIFYNIERAYRSVTGFCTETEQFIDSGIHPHFVMERLDFSTAAGVMLGRILAVIAQYHSDMISERTREALAIKRALAFTKLLVINNPCLDGWEDSDVYIPFRPMPKTAVARGKILSYIRMSHFAGVESGLGLEHQRRSNRDYAQRLIADNPSLEFVEDHYEDLEVSAFYHQLHNRPAGSRLLTDVRPGDHVLFYRCDRGFRQPYDFAVAGKKFSEMGVSIHLVDSGICSTTTMGMLYMHILSAFGALESAIKSERNKEIHELARAAGRPTNKPPLHCKTVVRQGRKRLVYDYSKIRMSAAVWILHKLGYSFLQTVAIINTLRCLEMQISLRKLKRSRKGATEWWLQRRRDRWEELRDNMPAPAVKEAFTAAMDLLSNDVPESHRKHCQWANFPVVDIRDRLIASGIEPSLVGSTPILSHSASVPA